VQLDVETTFQKSLDPGENHQEMRSEVKSAGCIKAILFFKKRYDLIYSNAAVLHKIYELNEYNHLSILH